MNQKRGRPKRFNEDLLLQTVQQMFHRNGYHGTGVADICKQVCITPTSLYNAFGSKQNLFIEAISAYRKDLDTKFADAILQISSPKALFRSVLEFATLLFTEKPENSGCLLFNLCDISANPVMLDAVNGEVQNFEHNLSNNIAQAGATHATDLAKILVTLFRGLSSDAKMGASYEDLIVRIEFFCHAFE